MSTALTPPGLPSWDLLDFEPPTPVVWPATTPSISMRGMAACTYAVVPRDGNAIARGNNETDRDVRRCLCGEHELTWRRDLQSWVCLWRRR